MITFNDIYEASRKERYSDQLQPLSKNFIPEIASYLKEKQQLTLKSDDIFSDAITKTKKQLENATTLFKELMVRRRKKILNLVLIASETGISKQDFENMLVFEKELFEEIMKNIEFSDKQIGELLNGRREKESQNQLVLFLEDVGDLVDMNGERVGPFDKGQIANIPRGIAEILIEDGKVEISE